jgi:hypothetical protein
MAWAAPGSSIQVALHGHLAQNREMAQAVDNPLNETKTPRHH